MTTIGLIPSPRPTAVKGVVTDKVRILIAEYLYVDMESVMDELHFADDLGADWVDCVDLMIAIEEFAGVQLADDDLDRIVTVGDLIRYIEAAVFRSEEEAVRRIEN